MQLEKHIEVLLLTNDCVIVPGLGGFVAHHVASTYDDRDHSFVPPTRTLGFNAQLVINDSVLAQSYVDTYDIGYPEAMKQIEREVAELKQILSETGEYEFHGLGKLAYNAEGNLSFEPYYSGILSPTLYGLGLLEFERISTPIFQLTNASKHLTSSSERVVTIKVKTLRKIAVAAIALFGFFLFANPFATSTQQAQHSEATFIGGLFAHHPSESAGSEQEDVRATEGTAGTEMQAEAKSQEDYRIVLACKLPKANAQLIVDELKAEGLTAEVSESNGDVKVLYGHYDSRNDACNAINELSQHKYFNSAWIMKSE